MLKIKQINKIRTMYYEENWTVTQITLKMNLSRSTIYKYLHADDFNIKPRKKSARTKITEYIEIIDKWLLSDMSAPRKQRHTYKRIHNRLNELFPESNLSYNTVLRYARKAISKVYKSL